MYALVVSTQMFFATVGVCECEQNLVTLDHAINVYDV